MQTGNRASEALVRPRRHRASCWGECSMSNVWSCYL